MKKYLLIIATVFLFSSCWQFEEEPVHQAFWRLQNNSDCDIIFDARFNENLVWEGEIMLNYLTSDKELFNYRTAEEERVISFDDIKLIVNYFRVQFKDSYASWSTITDTTGNYIITPEHLQFGLDFFNENSWTLEKEEDSDGYFKYIWTFNIDQAFVDSTLNHSVLPKIQ
ncbi:MAG: hypothetical protein ACK5IJ_12120 [Mangrovibacterium sp.]